MTLEIKMILNSMKKEIECIGWLLAQSILVNWESSNANVSSAGRNKIGNCGSCVCHCSSYL